MAGGPFLPVVCFTLPDSAPSKGWPWGQGVVWQVLKLGGSVREALSASTSGLTYHCCSQHKHGPWWGVRDWVGSDVPVRRVTVPRVSKPKFSLSQGQVPSSPALPQLWHVTQLFQKKSRVSQLKGAFGSKCHTPFKLQMRKLRQGHGVRPEPKSASLLVCS